MTSWRTRVRCSVNRSVRLEESRRPTGRPAQSPLRSPSTAPRCDIGDQAAPRRVASRASSSGVTTRRFICSIERSPILRHVERTRRSSSTAAAGVSGSFGCPSGRTSDNSRRLGAVEPVSPADPVLPDIALSATLPPPVRHRCATRLLVYTSSARVSNSLVPAAVNGPGSSCAAQLKVRHRQRQRTVCGPRTDPADEHVVDRRAPGFCRADSYGPD